MINVAINYLETFLDEIKTVLFTFGNWIWNEATVQQVLIIVFGYIFIEMAFQNFQKKIPIIKRNIKREYRDMIKTFKKSTEWSKPLKYEYDLEKIKEAKKTI